MRNPAILVSTKISENKIPSLSRYSIKPSLGSIPSTFEMEGLATSASINSTFLSRSLAILKAKLIAVKVLPSPGKLLVIKIRLALFIPTLPFPNALFTIGLFIFLYSSIACVFESLGSTKPNEVKRVKSISTISLFVC